MHLVAFAAIVEFVHDNGYFWLFYVGNGVALVVTLVALWLSWLHVQAPATTTTKRPTTPQGRMRFLGLVRPARSTAINLLLILLEGSYIFFIGTGRA